jgi:NhaP-type Na+/H+ or K+/H+ antiporter
LSQEVWLKDVSVTIALALAAGMVAQAVARHLRVPGIVMLIAAGVLLGPDVANQVQPELLQSALPILVGFAVAIILFEGGMNLNLKRIREQAIVIRRLLTVGVVITAIGGGVAVHYFMGWSWPLSATFGALVVVTGPTVVTPLLRRIKVHSKIETVLETEGVLVDAVGAFVAVVTLEVAVVWLRHGSEAGVSGIGFSEWLEPGLVLLAQLGFGMITGLAGGVLIAMLMRVEHLVPEGLENVFTLALVLALFQLSNATVPEAGILTVIVAGMVVGNVQNKGQRDLLEFKEQLTVLMIGMLFVLLAANVRVEQVIGLGWGGVATVAILMFVVRPLSIVVCAWKLGFNVREQVFLSWLAPRGIVAAVVASLIAQELSNTAEKANVVIPGLEEFQPLVFLVIAFTVLAQGLSSGPLARLLGLQRAVDRGYAILGANELGHTIGRLLRDAGEEVIFVDSNPTACNVVQEDGFKVVYGNALEERTLERAQLDDRAACLAVTTSQEANLLFAKRAIDEYRVPRVYLALARTSAAVNESVVRRTGATVLFAQPRDLELWALRLRKKTAPIETWRYGAHLDTPGEVDEGHDPLATPAGLLMPLTVRRGKKTFPANGDDGVRLDDVAQFALFGERADQARDWLRQQGWEPDTSDGAIAEDLAEEPEPATT